MMAGIAIYLDKLNPDLSRRVGKPQMVVSLVRECPSKCPKHSGLGIIVIVLILKTNSAGKYSVKELKAYVMKMMESIDGTSTVNITFEMKKENLQFSVKEKELNAPEILILSPAKIYDHVEKVTLSRGYLMSSLIPSSDCLLLLFDLVDLGRLCSKNLTPPEI